MKVTIPDGLLYAARSCWDHTYTRADAERDNSEYLRGQVETIVRASDWDAGEVDSADVREFVTNAIFDRSTTS